MKRRDVHIGPGAPSLLLVVVAVGMSILGLLALMSARSDARLAERSRRFAEAEYQTAARAERTLAGLDAVLLDCAGEEDYLEAVYERLPEDMDMEDSVVSWTEAGEMGRSLYCAVELAAPGETPRYQWVEHSFQAPEADFEAF